MVNLNASQRLIALVMDVDLYLALAVEEHLDVAGCIDRLQVAVPIADLESGRLPFGDLTRRKEDPLLNGARTDAQPLVHIAKEVAHAGLPITMLESCE